MIASTCLIAAPSKIAIASSSQVSESTREVSLEHVLDARATASPQGVLIEWRTGFETGTLGFNVYRTVKGRHSKLNPSLINGSALIAGPRMQSYAWVDPSGTVESVYEVESVDLRGDARGRVVAEVAWSASLPQVQQSELLSGIGGHKAMAVANSDWLDGDQTDRIQQGTIGEVTATSLTQQWAIANQPALKIGIRAEGWYRITQQQMTAIGFETTADARNLQMFVAGNEIAISVSRESGPLSPGDVVEFWGQGLDTPTTDTRVYWLVNSAQAGKRISIKGELTTLGTSVEPNRLTRKTEAATLSPSWFSGLGSLFQAAPTTLVKSSELITPPQRTAPAASADPLMTLSTTSAPAESTTTIARETVADSPKPSSSVAKAAVAQTPEAFTPKEVTVAPRSSVRRGASRRRRGRTAHPRRSHRLRRHNHAASPDTSAPAFSYTLQYKDRSVYYSAALNGDRENFFGPVVFGDGPIVPLAIRNLETTSTAPAQLQVALQGVSIESHQVRVFVNGSLAGLITFPDESAIVQTFTIPNSWLIEGNNAIKLVPIASSHDTSLLDYLRITYPHSLRAENDSLQFSVKSTQTARVEGFTNPNIRVLDVTDPTSIQQVRPIADSSGGVFAVTVPGGERGKARRLIALPESRVTQPASLTLNQISTLNRNTNSADLVIISHKDFVPSLAPLVAQRQAQGYSVAVVDVEDVFDEFSYGEHTSQAIRDLMLLAKNTWTRPPSYLLLVGDASYDPRNYGGAGNFDFVPSKLVDTGAASTVTALETASDDWLTDFDGDGIANISVGRLPVRSAAEANLLVSKIVNFSPANTGNRALLVADTQGSYYFNFEAADDQLSGVLPAAMTIQKVYRRLQPSDADAKANIISNLNAGQSVTVYSGHGNVNIWGGSIFTANDAATLTNGNRLSFVVVMDCLNGYFADPTLQSLAESLVKAPNGGAVASFASSGLTIPDGQHEMGLRMFQLLYGGTSIAIGDASRQAKSATTDVDVRRTWILFGDPTLKIR